MPAPAPPSPRRGRARLARWAPAAILVAMYMAVAEKQGYERSVVTGTAQSVFRATVANNNGIAGTVLTTGNGGSLQAWLVGSNISGASGEFAIRDSTGTSNALTITKGTLAAAFGGVTVLKNYTVATLPAAASYTYGTAFVSDATNAAGTGAGTAPTGGGSVKRMVYSDGAAWRLL